MHKLFIFLNRTITNLKRSLLDEEIQEERAQKTDYYKSTKSKYYLITNRLLNFHLLLLYYSKYKYYIFSEPKIDGFEHDLLQEIREAKPVPPPPPVPVVYKEDGDLHYCKYLTSLMKELPTKKKKLKKKYN